MTTSTFLQRKAAGFHDPDFVQLRTIRSYTGVSRFMAECSEEHVGWVKRPAGYPSPYSYSRTACVYSWGDHYVVIPEVAHKVFRVYSVAPRLVHATEEQAER